MFFSYSVCVFCCCCFCCFVIKPPPWCSRTLCVLLYSVPEESEPVRTGSSGLFVEKKKHVQLLLNLV